MTASNVDQIGTDIIPLLTNKRILEGFLEQIFEKAINEEKFVGIYARACNKIS